MSYMHFALWQEIRVHTYFVRTRDKSGSNSPPFQRNVQILPSPGMMHSQMPGRGGDVEVSNWSVPVVKPSGTAPLQVQNKCLMWTHLLASLFHLSYGVLETNKYCVALHVRVLVDKIFKFCLEKIPLLEVSLTPLYVLHSLLPHISSRKADLTD